MKGSSPGAPNSTVKTLLSEMKVFAEGQSITANYLLPWACIQSRGAEQTKNVLAQFATPVNEFLPGIKDGQGGVDIQLEDFADTPLHMTPAGARRRTNILGSVLKQNLPTPAPSS